MGPYEAFESNSVEAHRTRGAFLLVLGALLRREYEPLWEDIYRFRDEGDEFPGLDPLEYVEELNITEHDDILRSILEQHSLKADFALITQDQGYAELFDKILTENAMRLLKEPAPVHAVSLISIASIHPDPLIRCCANVSLCDVLKLKHTGTALRELFLLQFYESDDDDNQADVRNIARSALSFLPMGNSPPPQQNAPADNRWDSTLIHGTLFGAPGFIFPSPQWWETGGDFHNYIKSNPSPDLYDGNSPFMWGGGYSDLARNYGAEQLYDWLQHHLQSDSTIYAHSHGANLAMKTTHLSAGQYFQGGELEIENLVLLSCPIHWDLFYPNPNAVAHLYDVRVKHDWVIYADRLMGRIFRSSYAQQQIPPSVNLNGPPKIHRYLITTELFSHDASHDPKIWAKEDIANSLGL